MSDFERDSTESEELSEEEVELQEAFASGQIKPGLNIVEKAPKQLANNINGLKHKLEEIHLKLPWIERLDNVNKEAPLAPELAAKLLEQEQKRENQLKNNKKLPQFTPSEDPLLNDFKREMMFHRQGQATVMHAFPIIKSMSIPTLRPDDYFAEMAKSDAHMQKIRENLVQKQAQQQRSERVKQLRAQRKEGKAIQIQTKLDRLKEKKEMLDQVKRVRKGQSKDMSFLDGKKGGSKKAMEKRKIRDKKFGFGGKKRGSKMNTKESAADISDYDRPFKGSKSGKFSKNKRGVNKNQRPGKNRRIQMKTKKK